MTTLFSKIIAGTVPSFKIYENEHVYAFLDIRPIHGGHTLVVPKIEADHFTEVPEPYYSAVFAAAKIIGKAIREATGAPRVGGAVVGFEVPHFHYHLVPLWSPSDLNFSHSKVATPEELRKMQEAILKRINQT